MEVGKVYHVYNRGNNGQDIYFDDENYSFFLKQFDKYLSSRVDVIAYCLMPNHFHFLIRIKIFDGVNDDEISKAITKSFRDFLISYAKSINKKYKRTGALFQQKFKRKEVDNDFYFSWLIQYIHLNPVKAGLCNECSGWRYSSYNAIVSGKPTKIAVNEVLEWFGDLNEFVRIHRERIVNEAQIGHLLFKE